MRERFVRHTRIGASAERVFRWHQRPGALERLTPPWVTMRVVERTGGIEDGVRVSLVLSFGPLQIPWTLEHRDFVKNQQFRDVQVSGPFTSWSHVHRVEPDGDAGCYIEDEVEYELPGGRFGDLLGGSLMRLELERLFVYRHRILQHDMAVETAHPVDKPLKILVSGSSGLIGSALVPFLATAGHRVVRLVRPSSRAGGDAIPWDPAAGLLNPDDVEGFDAVIHLSGESLDALRWTAGKKQRILDSRVKSTRLLCETLAKLKRPPRVLLSASAIGFYGNRGGEILSEESRGGPGWLPEVCRQWEQSTESAAQAGIRVVNMRIGVVLSPRGGLLARLLPVARLGLGGPIGTGWQFMSLITIDDLVSAIYHTLRTDSLRGPVNMVGPRAIPQRELAKTLGLVLQRPVFLRLPAFAVQALMGEVANALVLSSAHVEPRLLTESGFVFQFPDMEIGLRHLLGRT